jgi:GWxTD domain-containing protein
MRFIFSFFSLLLCFGLKAQNQQLRAYLDTKQFYSPSSGNYLEVYIQFVGHTVNYLSVPSGLQGQIAISLDIKKGTERVKGDAYRLETPLMKDSIVEDFYDVKRIQLDPGTYTLSIQLVDLNRQEPPISTEFPIEISDLSKEINCSDIQTIEYARASESSSVFSKSGYFMIPRLSTFYPKELKSIPVYLEIYNTNQFLDTLFGLKQWITSVDTGKEIESLTYYSKHSSGEVIPILRNVDISTLTTGKYSLNYTIISKSMVELTTQSYLFERSNDIEQTIDIENLVLDPSFQASITNDSVQFYLESLIPISKPAEIKNIIRVLKSKNEELQRKHIQAYWNKTSAKNPTESWLKYKLQVLLVEKLYSNNFQEGFETDRGRVYLQYGAPTTIVQREVSSTEYPYEIWQYNKIGQFSNKRFIFYNPDLVNNAYRLLHSDMLGELKNPAWPQMLNSRNSTKGNVDDPNQGVQEHWGGNSNDLFRQY